MERHAQARHRCGERAATPFARQLKCTCATVFRNDDAPAAGAVGASETSCVADKAASTKEAGGRGARPARRYAGLRRFSHSFMSFIFLRRSRCSDLQTSGMSLR